MVACKARAPSLALGAGTQSSHPGAPSPAAPTCHPAPARSEKPSPPWRRRWAAEHFSPRGTGLGLALDPPPLYRVPPSRPGGWEQGPQSLQGKNEAQNEASGERSPHETGGPGAGSLPTAGSRREERVGRTSTAPLPAFAPLGAAARPPACLPGGSWNPAEEAPQKGSHH